MKFIDRTAIAVHTAPDDGPIGLLVQAWMEVIRVLDDAGSSVNDNTCYSAAVTLLANFAYDLGISSDLVPEHVAAALEHIERIRGKKTEIGS